MARQFFFRGLVALGLGGGAQYLLTHGQQQLGGIVYLVAALLFVRAVRPLMPELFPQEGGALGSSTVPTKVAGVTSRATLSVAERLAVLREHWREFTVSDLISGSIPPSLSASTVKTEGAAAAPALEARWAGASTALVEPQAILVSSQGLVFVVDRGNSVFCFDPEGNLLRHWSVPDLPQPMGLNLAVSPDGRRLYAIDAANRSVKVIALT